jgi:hypothetical protein
MSTPYGLLIQSEDAGLALQRLAILLALATTHALISEAECERLQTDLIDEYHRSALDVVERAWREGTR